MFDTPTLKVSSLVTELQTPEGTITPCDGVSFEVLPGQTLGIVGESGSGKSMTALSILGLLPARVGRVVGGEVLLEGVDLLKLSPSEMRRVRAQDLGVVFQDPLTSLNPLMTVGAQIAEAIRVRPGVTRREARSRSIELLELVGIPDPSNRSEQYPHEFSGGMRQRALIAIAIANDPNVLIADEPTTALDVTIQAQVLDVLKIAQEETKAAVIFITHDLGVVAEVADQVAVMYAGRVVEYGDVRDVFRDPRHPYTVGLMKSSPRVEGGSQRLTPIEGSPPSGTDIPAGCPFHPRCQLSDGRAICSTDRPPLYEVGVMHGSACHFWSELPTPGKRLS